MTTEQWLDKARSSAPKLRELISSFHPLMHKLPPDQMRITAPNAEQARRTVVASIRRNTEGDPVADFDAALEAGNVPRLISIMDSAWFGVPESTECWRLEGFREAVSLLDDPPE